MTTIGSSNRLIYDNCAFKQQIDLSTNPLGYYLYRGKYENCNRCVVDKFWRPFELVDYESDLLNINRPSTRCNKYKYNPNCEKTKTCISTFEKSNPIVLSPDLCPIIHNNLPKIKDNHVYVPIENLCQ